MIRRRVASIAAVGLLLAVVAACGGPSSEGAAAGGTCLGRATAPAAPFPPATDPGPMAAPVASVAPGGSAGAGPGASGDARSGASGGAAPGRAGRDLPDLALDCLDGSGSVRLAALTRPTVISLWASYCVPCHEELPHLEAFARAAGGSVAVIGVDTADTHSAAASVVSDLGLTFPMLFDPDQRLYTASAGAGLPATLFVADGRILYLYERGTPLDRATLDGLAARFFGVTVHG